MMAILKSLTVLLYLCLLRMYICTHTRIFMYVRIVRMMYARVRTPDIARFKYLT